MADEYSYSKILSYCKVCEKEIIHSPAKNRIACSPKCSHKIQPLPKTYNKVLSRVVSFCMNCDDEILHRSSKIRQFCNQECMGEYYKNNNTHTKIENLHKRGKCSSNWRGGISNQWGRYHSIRDGKLKWVLIMNNPFPEEVDIDYHHINNMLVVPMPRFLHRMCHHSTRVDKHRNECIKILNNIYSFDFRDILNG